MNNVCEWYGSKRKSRRPFPPVQDKIGQSPAWIRGRVERLANIERGKSFPNINYLHYFYHTYRLDINWLLTNDGEMFLKDKPGKESFIDLVNMMRVPLVEKVILAKLVEAKALLREDIKAYFAKLAEKKENGS